MNGRRASIERNTRETQIRLSVELDGSGESDVSTGVPFLDHMLVLWARHGLFDLIIAATGDTDVDLHHTVEDTGICLGLALAEAAGDKAGIVRYGAIHLPMDEALVLVALDFSGRPYLEYDLQIAGRRIGDFEADLGEEFFRAVAVSAGLTLHVRQLAGRNPHHILEAAFKGFGRALDAATRQDSRVRGIPSTKGTL